MKKGILVLGISLLFCSLGVVGTAVKAESNEFNATTVLAGNKDLIGARRAALDIEEVTNNMEPADVSAYVSDVKVQADNATKSLRFVAAVKADKFWADGTASLPGEFGFVVAYVKDGDQVQKAYAVENYYHSIAAGNSFIVNEHSSHKDEAGVTTLANTFGADYNLMIALTVEGLTGYENNIIQVAPYVKLDGESVYKFNAEEPRGRTLNEVAGNATHMLHDANSGLAYAMKYNATANPKQYEATGIALQKGDTIAIKNDGAICTIVFENTEYATGFVAPRDGNYDFYYKAADGNKLWITTPAQVNSYVVNDGAEVKMTGTSAAGVALNANDVVKVKVDGEVVHTETIAKTSEYTIAVDGLNVTFVDENEAVASYVVTVKVNSNWAKDNPRFAAYLFGAGEVWLDMTKGTEPNTYYVDLEDYQQYPNIVFCRMNPGAAANNWNNRWNQTADLTIAGHYGQTYTIAEGNDVWDKGPGSWSN